jgi:hypothetical protein
LTNVRRERMTSAQLKLATVVVTTLAVIVNTLVFMEILLGLHYDGLHAFRVVFPSILPPLLLGVVLWRGANHLNRRYTLRKRRDREARAAPSTRCQRSSFKA